jgi:hypothetical protein
MVLCEGGTEEGMRRGMAASGNDLFKWCHGEQKGGLRSASTWG